MSTPLLTTENLSKHYPGTLALDKVNYSIHGGKVNALVGENGAGKSTLMKILAGNIKPSGGHIYYDGRTVAFSNAKEAQANGIGIIHQELNLFPNLTIAENVFVGKEIRTKARNLNRRQQNAETEMLLQKLDYPLDPEQRVSELKVGERQIVEIIKAIAQEDLRILIMDEPTSSLSAQEVRILFRVISELTAMGIAIVYISHRLEEVLSISDRISILRDGRLIAESATSEASLEWIVHNMVGNRVKEAYQSTAKSIGEKPVLETKNLSLLDPQRGYLLRDVSISLRKNEVLGVYGLLGSGRTELLESIIGLTPRTEGDVLFANASIKSDSTAQRIQKGIFLIPEDRQRQSLIQKSSIENNIVLSDLRRLRKGPYVRFSKKRQAADNMVRRLSIKLADVKDLVSSLSGGNQQKVVIARGLLTSPKVLLMDEPTKGVDVGAKADIYQIVSKLSEEGLSIIVVSSEIDEVLAISDRVLVLSAGRVAGEYSGEEKTEKNIVKASAKFIGV